jgi:hypothetical protein
MCCVPVEKGGLRLRSSHAARRGCMHMERLAPCVTIDELWSHARAPERRLLDYYYSSNSPTGSGGIQRRVVIHRPLAVSRESQDRDAYGDGFMHGDWGRNR